MKSCKEAVITFFNERDELIAISFRDHKSGKAICFRVEELGIDGISELFAEAMDARKALIGSRAMLNDGPKELNKPPQPSRVIEL